MELKTNTDISIDHLTFSEDSGDTPKTIDIRQINEPLFIIQISTDFPDLDILQQLLFTIDICSCCLGRPAGSHPFSACRLPLVPPYMQTEF